MLEETVPIEFYTKYGASTNTAIECLTAINILMLKFDGKKKDTKDKPDL